MRAMVVVSSEQDTEPKAESLAALGAFGAE